MSDTGRAPAREPPYELCAETRLPGSGGDESVLQRMWLTEEHAEVIRWVRTRDGQPLPEAPYLTEAELVQLLDRAMDAGVFTPLFLRQLLLAMERHAASILQS